MGSKMWRRANLQSCTQLMLDVLERLHHANNNGVPYLYLEDVNQHTINALIDRDWILGSFALKNIDTSYRITGRGRKAYEIYSVPVEEYDIRRFDGICCRCGLNERGFYNSGTRMPYCESCTKKIDRRKYALQGYQKKQGLCPDCGLRQKHVMASGEVRSYCKPCRRKRAAKYRQEKYRRELKKVQAGEILLCYRCHENPRWLTGKTLQDYCHECSQKYKRERRYA
jgi:hypothetical protein